MTTHQHGLLRCPSPSCEEQVRPHLPRFYAHDPAVSLNSWPQFSRQPCPLLTERGPAPAQKYPLKYSLKYPLKYPLKLNQMARQARRQTRRQTPRRSRELFLLVLDQHSGATRRAGPAETLVVAQPPRQLLLPRPLGALARCKRRQVDRQARHQTRRQTPRRSRELFLLVLDSSDGLGRDLSGGSTATPAALL